MSHNNDETGLELPLASFNIANANMAHIKTHSNELFLILIKKTSILNIKVYLFLFSEKKNSSNRFELNKLFDIGKE